MTTVVSWQYQWFADYRGIEEYIETLSLLPLQHNGGKSGVLLCWQSYATLMQLLNLYEVAIMCNQLAFWSWICTSDSGTGTWGGALLHTSP
jgi:hypothetical protein